MLSSFFNRKPEPLQATFRPPAHQAAVQVEESDLSLVGMAYGVKLGAADQVAANQYLASKPLASEYEKKADAAKKALLASLGSASSAILPDGRTVTKHVTPVPAEANPRKAHNRTSIAIQ